MTLSEIQKQYWDELTPVYDEREARTITKIVFEKILELQSHKLFLERFRILTTGQVERLNEILKRLLTSEPVQYVLEEADFCGLKFKVNSNVLIPRPETEELVAWVKSEIAGMKFQIPNSKFQILDIGSGSACIPVSLAKEFPSAKIEGVDISEGALAVGEENNRMHQTEVKFFKLDILSEPLPENRYDIVVSNPPYIAISESATMSPNVLKFEPHLALFTTGEDDLIFYRTIATKALNALKPGGQLFFEINYAKGQEITTIMHTLGYKDIELRKDLSGKDRMIKGRK